MTSTFTVHDASGYEAHGQMVPETCPLFINFAGIAAGQFLSPKRSGALRIRALKFNRVTPAPCPLTIAYSIARLYC